MKSQESGQELADGIDVCVKTIHIDDLHHGRLVLSGRDCQASLRKRSCPRRGLTCRGGGDNPTGPKEMVGDDLGNGTLEDRSNVGMA